MGDTRIRMYVCVIRGQLAVVSSLLPCGIRGSGFSDLLDYTITHSPLCQKLKQKYDAFINNT